MTISTLDQLNSFIPAYLALSEKEKFGLARVFQDATGGKLSPFNSPSPVCVGVIPVAGPNGEVGFLGVRRAIPPFVGEIALAGGFLGKDEDPAVGVAREVKEETGVDVDHSAFGIASAKMGHNNNLLLFFTSNIMLSQDDLKNANANLANTDGEASEVVFITPSTPLCFPLHKVA